MHANKSMALMHPFAMQWGSAFLLTGDTTEQKKHLEVSFG